MSKKPVKLRGVTIRFAGDSGDGIQLTGSQFTNTTALVGNDLSTLPDFPAEIRAPAGTLYGVSGFQINFSSTDIHSPGDSPDVLVAMNPAALKVNLPFLKPHGIIVANEDGFDDRTLKLAGYESDPLTDGSLEDYQLIAVPITSITIRALEDNPLSHKEKQRCKNFFALGLMYWMFNRPLEPTLEWIGDKFAGNPDFIDANSRALKAGYFYGDTAELFTTRYVVEPAKLEKGIYRNISGNQSLALGLVTASVRSGLPLFLGSYPITPASDILHELSKHKNFDIRTFQAEDEIAAVCSAIGSSYGGCIGVTSTSGPGLSLKSEAIGLAVMVELPLVIINLQRGGPSTGLPTKTEQADLFQALFGRHGECPLAVLAPSTPVDCFQMAFEAVRIATKYMTPVILLSDGYLANGSEPWKIPFPETIPDIPVSFETSHENFQPYKRNDLYARPWVRPGTPGLEHRIGGLEKENLTGNVSYDPDNHDFMTRLREKKIQNIANDIPALEVDGPQSGDLLVLGWGSTYGSIRDSVLALREKGLNVSQAHLKYLNPLPSNTENVLKNFKKILIPELNLGQLSFLIRGRYGLPVVPYNKVRGIPFSSIELQGVIENLLLGES